MDTGKVWRHNPTLEEVLFLYESLSKSFHNFVCRREREIYIYMFKYIYYIYIFLCITYICIFYILYIFIQYVFYILYIFIYLYIILYIMYFIHKYIIYFINNIYISQVRDNSVNKKCRNSRHLGLMSRIQDLKFTFLGGVYKVSYL